MAHPILINLVLVELNVLRSITGVQKFAPIDVERMRVLRQAGWSYRDIGQEVGASYQTIWDLLNDGVKYLAKHKTPIAALVFCLGAYSVLSGTGLGLLVVGVRVLVVI